MNILISSCLYILVGICIIIHILTSSGVSVTDLVLRSVADEPLGVGERYVGRRRTVALVIGDDLDAIIQPNADAAVSGAEINPDRFAFFCSSH